MVCYLVENIFIEKLISYYLIGSNSALKKAKEEKSKIGILQMKYSGFCV